MGSNAYIATDGETVMKVGKANNPKRREREIALSLTVIIACLDESAARRVEDQLRQFVIEQGGIRHQSTIDWFKFDQKIYAVLCEFAGKLDGSEANIIEDDLDTEIMKLRERYYQILFKEEQYKVEVLEREVRRLSDEKQRLKQENDAQREKSLSLSERIGMLTAICNIALEHLTDKRVRHHIETVLKESEEMKHG
jgi:hypothetical protein